MEIELIICDFDGTLVDTKQANFRAYKEVLMAWNIDLTQEVYDQNFGLRLKEFVQNIGITDLRDVDRIRELKKDVYKKYFEYIQLNKSLTNMVKDYKKSGRKIAIASTAQRHNIENVLDYFNLNNLFDLILAGEDITKSKPNPECYIKVMEHFNLSPEQTLIFEDSEVGIQAAKSSHANYIIISPSYYEN